MVQEQHSGCARLRVATKHTKADDPFRRALIGEDSIRIGTRVLLEQCQRASRIAPVERSEACPHEARLGLQRTTGARHQRPNCVCGQHPRATTRRLGLGGH
jgi:hypothetical protein